MPHPRRLFLKTGTVCALFSLLSAESPANALKVDAFAGAQGKISTREIPYAAKRDPVYYLTAESFAPYLNSKFGFSTASSKGVVLELAQVKDLRQLRRNKLAAESGGECFSLVFHGSPRATLKQNNYRITHPALGEFSLLLAPIGKRDNALRYEAIINRLY